MPLQMDVRRSVDDPLFDARINILGFLNLLEACKDAHSRNYICVIRRRFYGDKEPIPAAEDHATEPLSPYGVSKKTGELYLAYYYAAFGLPYIALRYANVYGPRQSSHGEAGVVAIFIGQLSCGAKSCNQRRWETDPRLRLRRRCDGQRGGPRNGLRGRP